jgi:hypothetical protein
MQPSAFRFASGQFDIAPFNRGSIKTKLAKLSMKVTAVQALGQEKLNQRRRCVELDLTTIANGAAGSDQRGEFEMRRNLQVNG